MPNAAFDPAFFPLAETEDDRLVEGTLPDFAPFASAAVVLGSWAIVIFFAVVL